MLITLIAIGVVVLGIAYWIKREKDRRELEQYSVTPEAPSIHCWLRIPVCCSSMCACRSTCWPTPRSFPAHDGVPPQEIIKNPSLIPKDREVIVYCTCPSDKTSRRILRKARAMQLLRVKFLKGGLEAWKAKGFPVEPYNESFHLETGS